MTSISNNLGLKDILDNHLLDELSQDEKDLALSILKEISSQGTSKTYNKLVYADYREIPVDIETFITDDNYLGQAWKETSGKLKMYPF